MAGLPGSERYEILDLVGRGGMGLVYRAFDRWTGETVALKTLRDPCPEAVYALKREFRALSDIVHPNLARLHDLEVDEREAFFTMEFVAGAEFVGAMRAPAVEEQRFAPLRDGLRQLADGLGELHARGKLHRDVKPSNVFVEDHGGRVVLLDFGLVTGPEDGDGPRTKLLSGTFAYMSPEQTWGMSVTPAGDWYSAGVLLYECLTGALPFGESGWAVGLGRRRQVPIDPRAIAAGVPDDLAELALALLRYEPEARAGAREVRAAAGSPEALAPPRRAGSPVRFVGRDRERETLLEAMSWVREGRPVLGFVEGPSGIGKSALVEHVLLAMPERARALVLRSRCHPQESVRYEAVDGLVDELSRHLLAMEPAELARVAPPDLHALQRVFPVLGRVAFPAHAAEAREGEPHEIRRRAFEALRELLAGLAARQPVVLWIDDLQWGDADSAPLLRELLRPGYAPAVFFLFSYRSDEAESSALPAALAAMRSEAVAHAVSVELGPLSPEDSERLLCALVEAEGASLGAHAARVVAEADGSPFLIGELARGWVRRSRSLAKPDDASGLTLGGVVRERLRRLPAPQVKLLELLSVARGPLPRSVVLAAAGLGPAAGRMVDELKRDLLLRRVRIAGEDCLETFHDGIRQCIAADLGEAALRARHRALLACLEQASPAVGPEVLLHHAEGAGEIARAAGYARAAAQKASAALAFSQAAAFLERSLRLGAWDDAQRRALFAARADSLVNASRAADAAPIYLEAARGAPRTQNLDLRRLAAEQFLVSGRTEAGIQVLEPLLEELGIELPSTPERALASTARRLGELALRGTRFRERCEADVDPFETMRIDVCFSAARGLIMSDIVRAGYLPLRGLLLALRAGEPRRIGRSLAMVASAVLTPFGGPLALWRDHLLGRCDELAARTGDAYIHASAALARGRIGVLRGAWRDALSHSERALSILRRECRGVQWEKNLAHAAELRALDDLGWVDEADRRARQLAAESRQLDDRYGAVVAALTLATSLLAAGEPGAARRQLDAALEGWPLKSGFLIQHLDQLRLGVTADLYEGRAERAWERAETGWKKIEEAQFLRVPAARIDAYAMRARAALAVAAAAERRSEARPFLRIAAAAARRLVADGRPDAKGYGALALATHAALRGDRACARRQLARARDGFARAEMGLWSTLCAGGGIGKRVAEPSAWLAAFAPGIDAVLSA